MELTRKDFLRAGAVAVAAGVAGCGDDEARQTPPPADPDLRDWAAVKGLYALEQGKHNLSGFLLAPHPTPVREAIERHRRGLDAAPSTYLHDNEERLDAGVRAAAAVYLKARPEQIALTDSTTMGLGLVYATLRLREGEEILTTEHDHYSTHESLRLRAERTGASVRRARLYADPAKATERQMTDAIVRALKPATRYVAVTWVHSSTGVKVPVRSIARALRRVNARRAPQARVRLAVDGVHALGVEDADTSTLGADFLIAGTHKWLAGPRGTGIVFARDDAWARTESIIPPFHGGGPGVERTPGGYHSFEHRWALAEAFDLHSRLGPARVTARVHDLATRLKDGLAAMGHVDLVTPRDPRVSAGIVCFEVRGEPAGAVVDALAQDGVVASVTPYRIEYARLGPGLYTDEGDADAALDAVRKLGK